MALSRRIGRSRFTLLLLVLTSLTLLTLDFRGFGPLEQARSSVLSVFAPVGDGAANLFKPVGNLWHGAFAYDDLKRENDDLRAQIDDLQGQVTAGEVAKRSNQELLAQAKLPFVGDLQTVRARVTSGAVANFDDTIEIGKGSNDGIKKDMPVVTGTGLVGSVVQVSDTHAVVRLVTDTSFQVGVNALGSAFNGVARGQGTDNQLKATMDVTAAGRAGPDPGDPGHPRWPLPVGPAGGHGGRRQLRRRVAAALHRCRPAGRPAGPHVRERGAVGADPVTPAP